MSPEYKTLAHRWFEEVWNQRSEAAIDALLYEDCPVHGLTDAEGNTLRGPAGFKTLFSAFTAAYPDIHVIVEDTVSQQDRIMARCTVSGTHTGYGLGLAPTNARVQFTGICMIRIHDGQIAEAWNEFDFMDMYRQLGVVSLKPEQAKAA
jgi:steroid delta-isomerase-like uncharacterized protein